MGEDSAFGQASGEHERLRAAEAAFNVVGDNVSGVKNIYHLGGAAGEPMLAPRPLSRSLVHEVRTTFVDPEGWGEFRSRVVRQPVLLLRAPEASGRRTMAIRLLQSRNIESPIELLAAHHLDRLADLLDEGAGYLLTLERDSVLDAGTLSRCADRLGSRGCLVILCEDGASLGDGVRDLMVDAPAPPPPVEILASHLRRWMGEPAAEQLLADTVVRQFISSCNGPGTRLRDMAALALLLHEETEGGEVDMTAVQRRYRQRGDDELDTWFEGLPDLGARSFAIALAVLDGLPYEHVAQAAMNLQRRLERYGTPEDGHPSAGAPQARLTWRDPFAVPSRTRLTRLRAEMRREPPSTVLNRPPETVVRYRETMMRGEVLDRAWSGYQIHSTLLAWLKELIEQPSSVEVPFSAAAALGFLTAGSFRFVESKVLRDWASRDPLWLRLAVARALRASALDPQLRPSVEAFVEELADAPDWQRRATAALVTGFAVGLVDPVAAFRELDRFALIEDSRTDIPGDIGMAYSIMRSFVALMIDHPDESPAMAMGTLLRWSDDRRRRDTAHRVFLFIASQHTHMTTRTGPDGRTRAIAWPALLRMAHHDPHLRDPMIVLWRRALNEAFLNQVAEMVLEQWAIQAELDDDLLISFARLIRAIANDARTGSLLIRYARGWRADDRAKPLPRAAAAVEAVLAPSIQLPPAAHVHAI